MKKLAELGICPAPWAQGAVCKDMVVSPHCSFAVSAGSRREDAHLIAAAPELYEALLEIYEDFEPMCNTAECHGCKHEPGCNKWAQRARAALEKAGGKE